MIKLLVIAFLIAILISLGSGLVFLVRDTGDTRRTVKALTWRIALSAALIVVLIVLYLSGAMPMHNMHNMHN